MYLQTHETNIGAGAQMKMDLSEGLQAPLAISTLKEKLSQALSNSQSLAAYQFNSEKRVGGFVLDFYCESLNLAIAVDPHSSNGGDIINLHREKFLKERRMSFLRFDTEQVSSKIETVLQTIAWFISRYEKLNRLNSLAPRPAMAIAC